MSKVRWSLVWFPDPDDPSRIMGADFDTYWRYIYDVQGRIYPRLKQCKSGVWQARIRKKRRMA